MKIESGLNPNCSELVTKIEEYRTAKDIIPVLQDMSKVLKCSYGIEVGDYDAGIDYIVIFPVEELSDYFMQDPRADATYKLIVSHKKLMGMYPNLPKKFSEDYDRQLQVFYGKINPGIYYTKSSSLGPTICITDNEGYSDYDCLTFRCSQHCCTNEYPLLQKIMDYFKTDARAFDGGSTNSFEDWQIYWGIGCKADKKITCDTDDIEWNKKCPPDFVHNYELKPIKDFSEIPTKGANKDADK